MMHHWLRYLFLMATALFLLGQTCYSKSIKDYEYYSYDVVFTNPECEEYHYAGPINARDGSLLFAKPKNVYCKFSDLYTNQNNEKSAHHKIITLIKNQDLKSLKMAFLSFSNLDVINKICNQAIKNNNVKVRLIVDKKNKNNKDKLEKINLIKNCKPHQKYIDEGVANFPEVIFRGHSGGIGFAHNKVIYATYKSQPNKVDLIFGSANMSSGTTLHHENWHFLTTSSKSYFASVHRCLFKGLIQFAKSTQMSALKNFKNFIKNCKNNIEIPEESDIKAFIVPGEGEDTMEHITKNIKLAKRLSVAVHRFTHPKLEQGLKAASKSKDIRFVADDDLYWSGMINFMPSRNRVVCNSRQNPNLKFFIGANMCSEYFAVKRIERAGAKIKYMQTNQKIFLLHHNKYIIFDFEDKPDAVHTGAGNFTEAAFSDNLENYYYISIPEIVNKFKKQYEYVWNVLATEESKLPRQYVLP